MVNITYLRANVSTNNDQIIMENIAISSSGSTFTTLMKLWILLDWYSAKQFWLFYLSLFIADLYRCVCVCVFVLFVWFSVYVLHLQNVLLS